MYAKLGLQSEDERDSLEEVRVHCKIEEALNGSQREGLICVLN
jgi:hypothetical protein